MAVKAGQILHSMSRTVIDRIQTAGPGDLNIPTEKIYELGNFQAVATVRDLPDLSFNLDVLDVDTEVEALLTGSLDPSGEDHGDGTTPAAVFDFLDSIPMNIVSPWKSGQNKYDIISGVATPHLTLEQASYQYGLDDNAGETYTLRGDSIFYVPGSVYEQIETGDGATTAYSFTVTTSEEATPATDTVSALPYVESGETIHALSVSVDGERLVPGEDYTENADTGITFTKVFDSGSGTPTAPLTGSVIKIVFGFDPSTLTDGDHLYPQTAHEGLAVKPAAIRGKNINVYVAVPQPDGNFAESGNKVPALADFKRWTDVQSFSTDWSINLEDDFEFGNPRAVSRDATDPPEVTGSVEFRHRTPDAMYAKMRDITGVVDGEIVGPQSAQPVQIMVQLMNPDGHGTSRVDVGEVLKTLYVPDARFVLPGYEGQVQQKLNQTMNYDSDAGLLRVMRGKPADDGSQFLNVQGTTTTA